MTSPRLILCLLALVGSVGAQTVRIGVFTLFHPQTLVVVPAGDALVADAAGQSISLGDRSLRVQLAGAEMHVTMGGRSWRSSRLLVHARDGRAADFTLSVPGKIRRRYRGALEIVAAAGELVPVVNMDQELAVASIIAVESPPGAPPEALKALAVAARSFLAARASGHALFDFCDSTHCQFLRQPPPDDSPAAQAARATRGIVLTFHDSVFTAMYTPACGGRTRSLADLELPVRDYPYYSVECPYCQDHPRGWTRELPRPVSGERDRLSFVRRQGWGALPGNNYRLQQREGRLVAEGSGLGHGLGLCERGASALAAQGQSFLQILEHYYPNAVITATRLATDD